jgi:hypothetical protein
VVTCSEQQQNIGMKGKGRGWKEGDENENENEGVVQNGRMTSE